MSGIINGEVPLSLAVSQTKKWQCNRPNEPKAFRFDKSDFEHLLSEPNVAYIRIYFGEDDQGKQSVFAVGVDQADYDLTGTETNSRVYDFAQPCPPTCAPNHVLNHEDPCQSL
ncbi:hypothetical protein KFE98_17865 [bacterium SCSIO 12741]|nr:hypothetical protein KFE98_17865 [bacterium SCSIO 12741]